MGALAISDPAALIASDMRASVVSYGQHALREWRLALGEIDGRLQGYTSPGERTDLLALADHLRYAVGAFERALTNTYPEQDRAPESLTWLDLNSEFARCEQAGWALWAQVKVAAHDAQATGKTALQAIEGSGATPWDRAQSVALRDALIGGLQPRDGLELILVDGMTQALAMHRRWLHQHAVSASVDARRIEREANTMQDWQPPRLTEAQAIDRAALTADRFQRQFLRLLRAFRDGRKVLSSVTMMGGQLNVAGEGGQQIIAAPRPRPRRVRRANPRKRK